MLGSEALAISHCHFIYIFLPTVLDHMCAAVMGKPKKRPIFPFVYFEKAFSIIFENVLKEALPLPQKNRMG